MAVSGAISEGMQLPVTLCAGVGSADVIEVIELFRLAVGSLVLGDD
jgi:hypothetical protein